MISASPSDKRTLGLYSTLVAMTMALNILGLCVPLTAQIIFNRILPAPNTTTLPVVVVLALVVTALEAVLRFARTVLSIEETLKYNQTLISAVFERLVRGAAGPARAGAAQAIVYFGRVSQVAEDFGGKSIIAAAELSFVPLILGLVFFISPLSGTVITISVAIGMGLTLADGHKLNRLAGIVSRKTERRYSFLLSVLSGIHSIKALGIEGRVGRQFEVFQADLARCNYRLAIVMGRLMNEITVANQWLIVVALLCGAYGVASGSMSIGAVAAVILLSGRLMPPLQRAAFIYVQAKDLCESRDIIVGILESDGGRPISDGSKASPVGKLEAGDVAFQIENSLSVERYKGLELQLRAGEVVAISGPSEDGLTHFMRILAGVEKPDAGVVSIDGRPVATLSQSALNASVALVTSTAIMFKGTIRDNITRFGEVTVDQALAVAAMLGVEDQINQLPQGLDTQLAGEVVETVAASLCQQIAVVRALAHRPRLILFDNADRGLDQLAYANLHRFIAQLRGRATVVIVSEDRNLTGGASRHLVLHQGGLELESQAGEEIPAYRGLKL